VVHNTYMVLVRSFFRIFRCIPPHVSDSRIRSGAAALWVVVGAEIVG
jgi:hypothetical protein